jgi:hypothetical protein
MMESTKIWTKSESFVHWQGVVHLSDQRQANQLSIGILYWEMKLRILEKRPKHQPLVVWPLTTIVLTACHEWL